MRVQDVQPNSDSDSDFDGEEELARHSRGWASGVFALCEIALMSVLVAFIYGLAKLA